MPKIISRKKKVDNKQEDKDQGVRRLLVLLIFVVLLLAVMIVMPLIQNRERKAEGYACTLAIRRAQDAVLVEFFSDPEMTENDAVKSISIKYKLGIQEEKVLNLLMQDLSNQEIADRLYVSVNTIRNHVANIYKKTGMKKKELKEKCFYRTN